MNLTFDRSSVCMGDDAFDHRETKTVSDEMQVEQLLEAIAGGYPQGREWTIFVKRGAGQMWEIGKILLQNGYKRCFAQMRPSYAGKMVKEAFLEGDYIWFS